MKNLVSWKENIPSRKEWLAGKDRDSRTISATLIRPVGNHSDTTTCEVETWSGRYHQIRAICEAIGHPVCGDTKYNHDPRHHNHRRTNPMYSLGQMLICKKLEIPALGISVESGFEIDLAG